MKTNIDKFEKKVSIIVPVYNRANFLPKCINSLLSQKYNNIEIILIDDGSTDDSYKICCEFSKKDSRVVTFHKDNGGVQSARNKGIELSTGYYMCFVDADDYVSENYVYNFVRVFEDDGVECVVSGHYRVNSSDDVLINNDYMINLDVPNLEPERWALYFERFGCYVWNHMFISKVVKDNNICFNKDIIIFDDTAFTMNYINVINSIGFTNSNDYYYVCDHDELTIAKRLKNKSVSDDGCKEKVISCITKHEHYFDNYNKPFDKMWLSSSLFHIAFVSFILYMSTIYNYYRYSHDFNDDRFNKFYYFVKSKSIVEWPYKYECLHTELPSIKLLLPMRFIFRRLPKCIFKFFCIIIGSQIVHRLRIRIRKDNNKW